MTLSVSADLEVYLGGGISDLETAKHLSQKLGTQCAKRGSHGMGVAAFPAVFHRRSAAALVLVGTGATQPRAHPVLMQ